MTLLKKASGKTVYWDEQLWQRLENMICMLVKDGLAYHDHYQPHNGNLKQGGAWFHHPPTALPLLVCGCALLLQEWLVSGTMWQPAATHICCKGGLCPGGG